MFLAQSSALRDATISGVIGGIAGSVMGAIVAAVFQKLFAHRAGESSLIDQIVLESTEIENLALQYWILDCRGDSAAIEQNRQRAAELGAKLKSGILRLRGSIRGCSEQYRWTGVDFTQLVAEINDSCTNGNFEAKRRDPEPHRIEPMSNVFNRLRTELRKRRI